MGVDNQIIFVWDLEHNAEIGAFDVGNEYDVCWDNLGNP